MEITDYFGNDADVVIFANINGYDVCGYVNETILLQKNDGYVCIKKRRCLLKTLIITFEKNKESEEQLMNVYYKGEESKSLWLKVLKSEFNCDISCEKDGGFYEKNIL